MKNRTGCFFLFGILALVLFLMCGGAAGWLYWRSVQDQPSPFVQIRAPENGALTDLNESLPLMAYAEASRPVLRLEVYADGALIAAANGDNNTLTLVQPWTVTTPGRHALLARAFFAADDFADSEVVFVDTADLSGVPVTVNVDALPRGEGVTEIRVGDLAAAAGTTPDEIARLNPGLPPAPEAVIPPGTPLTLPRHPNPAPAASPAGSSAPPAAPAVPPPAPGAPGSDPADGPASRFDGETHSCSQIAMRWTDSADETAYRIYQIAPGERLMSLLATLPANTLTYATPVTRVGTYRYFLAPVRPRGEMVASMLSVEIGPECSQAGTGATTSLNLLLLSLTTQEAYDGVYCYVSFNGSRYERLPAEPGLLRPSGGELYYELPLQLPSRGLYSFTVPSDGLVRLEGECWGRRAAESLRIGRFSGSHARSEWDGRDLTNELLAFEPRPVASLTGAPAAAGGASFLRYRIQPAASRFDLSTYNTLAPGVLRQVYLDAPAVLDPLEGTDTEIPAPTNLRIERNWLCENFPTTNPNIEQSVCVGPLVPMLRWDWRGNAFYGEADIFSWQVNVSVRDVMRPNSPWVQLPGMLVIRPLGATTIGRSVGLPVLPSNYACGTEVRLTVTTITSRGNSLPSQPLIVRQPECRNLGLVRITVNAITVGPSASTGEVLDNGDICVACADRRMEVFGDIFIGMDDTAPTFSNPPNHGLGTILLGNCPNNTACLTQSRYQWRSEPPIAPWLFETEGRAAGFGSRGEITLTAVLRDYDTNNGPDNYCVATHTLQPRSDAEWTRINETVILRSDLGEASCEIEIRIQGISTFGAP